jgi:hypothetical protein
MVVGTLRPRAYTFGECLWSKPSTQKESGDPVLPLAILDPPPRLYDVKTYVLRSPSGQIYGEEDDLIVANQKARLLRRKITVYRRGGEVEVPMSFSGPGGWTGSMRREVTKSWKAKK